MEIVELLKMLTQTNGVSGDEENVVSLLTDILEPYGKVEVDALNNVTCTFGEGYHFLLDAHLDEIGFIVTEITDDGFIKFDKLGGIDLRMLPSQEVIIHGKEKVFGVISSKPPHLQSNNDADAVPEIRDLSIDTGFSAKRISEIVEIGDRITLKKNFVNLLNSRISASCLDDRSGIAAIILALDELKKINCKITVLFSSQEEVGTRGAKTGAFGKDIDEAICVDVSFAYTPGCDKNECGNLSKGAMIGFSPILNKDMSDNLVKVCKDNNILFQREVMNGRTGTNADVISVCESGVKTALISIPEKYMHQSVEVIDLDDIESVSKLISLYVAERVGELNA